MAEPMPLGSVAELQGLVIPLNAAAVSGAFVWLYSSIVKPIASQRVQSLQSQLQNGST